MTAPLTPHDQPSDNPWQYPATPGGAAPGSRRRGPGSRAELTEAALITVCAAAAGLLLGFLWERLAPQVLLTVQPTGVFLRDTESENAIAIDGTFVLLGLAFGAVTAALVFLLRRRGGLPLVLALAAGGLLGSLLAWKFGVWLGPTEDVVAHAKQVGRGGEFAAPLQLNAKGALLAWPFGAMVVQLVLSGLLGPRDPQPQPPPQMPDGWQGWGSPR